MISSMTGFSALAIELDSGSLALEIRSVNHRYLDLQLRIPEELRVLELPLREAISAQISRGKVECRVSFTARASANIPARINLPLLRQLAQWNAEVRDILPAARDLDVADILRWNGILESKAMIADKLHDNVLDLLQQTLREFNAARAREGEKLKDFLKQRVGQIDALRVGVAPRIPAAIKAYEEKLRVRLLEALANHDDDRLRQEISLFASKIDMDEELSRLHTHLTEMERVLEKGGSVGKRLDFLMQELHREANTLGSKSVDAEVSRASMEMKILIEQMREQIQNLE
ncbi:MAG TPA: YicC/YloC family endoribonuclease [Gallionellaceae bacterium]|nr:YicC/YloC family endoribonuclease [Gallionellaceae bacterium]